MAFVLFLSWHAADNRAAQRRVEARRNHGAGGPVLGRGAAKAAIERRVEAQSRQLGAWTRRSAAASMVVASRELPPASWCGGGRERPSHVETEPGGRRAGEAEGKC